MLRKSLVSLLVLLIYLGSCFIIYNSVEARGKATKISSNNIISTTNTANKTSKANFVNNLKKENDKEKPIAILSINKINLKKEIYDINSKHNNVEENVTILNDDDNLIVLAAHSGPGVIAYFDDLDELEINDKVELKYKNNNLTYKVIKIEEQLKDGTIEINKTPKKRLILTTCSKKDKLKQLVITTEKIDA